MFSIFSSLSRTRTPLVLVSGFLLCDLFQDGRRTRTPRQFVQFQALHLVLCWELEVAKTRELDSWVSSIRCWGFATFSSRKISIKQPRCVRVWRGIFVPDFWSFLMIVNLPQHPPRRGLTPTRPRWQDPLQTWRGSKSQILGILSVRAPQLVPLDFRHPGLI